MAKVVSVVFLMLFFSPSLLADKVLRTEKIAGYEIILTALSSEDPRGKQSLTIARDGKPLVVQTGVTDKGIQYQTFKLSPNPFVIVSAFSGVGAHCCSSLNIYSLGDTLVTYVPPLSPGFWQAHQFFSWPATLDSQGRLLITTQDPFWFYWHAPYVNNGAPSIIWYFNGQGLGIAVDEMQKNLPSEAEWQNEAKKIRENMDFWKQYSEEAQEWQKFASDSDNPLYPGMLTKRVLQFLLAGYPKLAWAYLETAWNPSIPNKETFIKDLKQKLSEDPYWQLLSQKHGFSME